MWLSRRGGCTKRTGRNREGFQQHHQPDDFMDMSDTPSQLHQQQARPFIPPTTANAGYADLSSVVTYNDNSSPYTYSDHPQQQHNDQYYMYNQQQDPSYMAGPAVMGVAQSPNAIDMKPDEVVQHKPNVA